MASSVCVALRKRQKSGEKEGFFSVRVKQRVREGRTAQVVWFPPIGFFFWWLIAFRLLPSLCLLAYGDANNVPAATHNGGGVSVDDDSIALKSKSLEGGSDGEGGASSTYPSSAPMAPTQEGPLDPKTKAAASDDRRTTEHPILSSSSSSVDEQQKPPPERPSGSPTEQNQTPLAGHAPVDGDQEVKGGPLVQGDTEEKNTPSTTGLDNDAQEPTKGIKKSVRFAPNPAFYPSALPLTAQTETAKKVLDKLGFTQVSWLANGRQDEPGNPVFFIVRQGGAEEEPKDDGRSRELVLKLSEDVSALEHQYRCMRALSDSPYICQAVNFSIATTPLLEQGNNKTYAALTMDVCGQDSLLSWVAARVDDDTGKLDVSAKEKLQKVVDQLKAAVDDMTKANVFHRNLHPYNILVSPEGDVKLIGFSRALMADDVAANVDDVAMRGADEVVKREEEAESKQQPQKKEEEKEKKEKEEKEKQAQDGKAKGERSYADVVAGRHPREAEQTSGREEKSQLSDSPPPAVSAASSIRSSSHSVSHRFPTTRYYNCATHAYASDSLSLSSIVFIILEAQYTSDEMPAGLKGIPSWIRTPWYDTTDDDRKMAKFAQSFSIIDDKEPLKKQLLYFWDAEQTLYAKERISSAQQ